MSHPQPSPHNKRILLAVTGLSPQIVTETLYALATHPTNPWIPTEIHLLTTEQGKQRAELALLSDDPGWFHRLRKDYDLPSIRLDERSIHVLTDAQGQPLDDIRTPTDNEQTANQITELMRRFTADDDSALHVSIAGGRKTMGYYLGYALSLFGRPQDRLSHVLVSEPFESSWNFFYPTPYSQVIETRTGDLVDTADARVTLAEIPFFSLRHGLPEGLLTGRADFSEVVAAATRLMEPPRLEIDLKKRAIRASDKEIVLTPAQLAFYSLFARRAKNGQPPLTAPVAQDQAWAERFLDEYQNITGPLGGADRTHRALEKGMDTDYFSHTKSALHRQLKQALGAAAQPYLIADDGARPKGYHLPLPPEAIHFIDA